MFDVKVGIPMPAARPVGRPAHKYPFDDMARAGSFFVALGDDTERAVINRMMTNIRRWKSKTGNEHMAFRVVPAPHPDLDVPAIGVWRIT